MGSIELIFKQVVGIDQPYTNTAPLQDLPRKVHQPAFQAFSLKPWTELSMIIHRKGEREK